MPKTYVLDASAFIYGMIPEGVLMTPSKVYGEVRDRASRLKLEMLPCLVVKEPEERFLRLVRAAADETGDAMRLSPSDVDLLALGAGEKASGNDTALLTDDYAVQNVARRLDLEIIPLHQKRIKYKIVWEKRCMGCNRTYKDGDVCEVCGSPLRMKKRSSRGNQDEKR